MNTKLLLLGLLLAAPALQAKTPTAKQAQRWLDKGAWAHGWAVRPDASVNAVEFATQYAAHPALWDSLFTYLATTNLDALPLGRVDLVPGRLWVTVSEYVRATSDDTTPSRKIVAKIAYE